MFNNRQYAIFSVSELNQIDFDQVLETSAETVRKSVDGTRTFVKWDSEEQPACISQLTTLEGMYTYEEILAILSGPDWVPPISLTMEGGQGGS